MPPTRKKKVGPGRPKDDALPARRRADIIKCAIDEFGRRGYFGADLDVVAANAGCSKGTLYNYFKSKGDLFNASVDHVMFGMVEAVGVSEAGDPLDQLSRLVSGFLRHFAENPQHVELLVQERSDFRDREEPTYNRYRAASRLQWGKRFERLMTEGRMRRMPADRAVDILGNLLYGTVFLNHFRRRQVKPERQAAELLDVFLGGLLTPSGFRSYQNRPDPP